MSLVSRTARNGIASQATRRSTCHRKQLKIIAFKEHDALKDWRIKQMVDTCHVYYANVWSRGDLAAADTLLDPQFVHRDLCGVAGWGSQAGAAATGAAAPVPPTGMVVGPRAFKVVVEAVRQQYPDLYVEVEEVAVSDTHRLFVSWVSHGTQLAAPPATSASSPAFTSGSSSSSSTSSGASSDPNRSTRGRLSNLFSSILPSATAVASSLHAAATSAAARGPGPGSCSSGGPALPLAPSYHNSLVRGVDIVTFNPDRSRILEVNAFRTLSSDERHEVEWRLAPNPLEIRLARLHWEPEEGRAGCRSSSSSKR